MANRTQLGPARDALTHPSQHFDKSQIGGFLDSRNHEFSSHARCSGL